jgi:hypothetical protein
MIDCQYVEDISRILQALNLPRKTKTRAFNTQGDVRPVVEGVKYLKTLAPSADLKIEPRVFGIPWRYDTTTPLEGIVTFFHLDNC